MSAQAEGGMQSDFWQACDELVAGGRIVVDRPKGSAHPRYPESRYPFDYGHVTGTTAGDKAEVDVWLGTSSRRKVTAVLLCVDLEKHDVEAKLLLGCTDAEIDQIGQLHNAGRQTAIGIRRSD